VDKLGWHDFCDPRVETRLKKTGVKPVFLVSGSSIKKPSVLLGGKRLVLVVSVDRAFRLVAGRSDGAEVDLGEVPRDRSFHELVTIFSVELVAHDWGGHVDANPDLDLTVVVEGCVHVVRAVLAVGVGGAGVRAVPEDVQLCAVVLRAHRCEVGGAAEAFSVESDTQVGDRLVDLIDALGRVLVGQLTFDSELAAPVQVLGRALHVVGAGRHGGGLDVQRHRLEAAGVVVVCSGIVVVGTGATVADSGAITVRAVAREFVTSPQHQQGEEAQAQDSGLEAGHP